MRKQLMIATSVVVLACSASFGQKQGKDSCPNDTKEVKERASIDVGVAKFERETRECQASDKAKDKDNDRGKDKGGKDSGGRKH